MEQPVLFLLFPVPVSLLDGLVKFNRSIQTPTPSSQIVTMA